MSSDLISTAEAPGEFDALLKLRPGEPYFALVGRDRLAPALVQKWADENRQRAIAEFNEGKIDEERRDRELRKSTQAEAIGWTMVSFKAGDLANRSLGEPTIKAYTGFELDEGTKRRDRMHSLRIRAAGALNNAVAECSELLEMVASFGDPGERAPLVRQIEDCTALMRATSERVTPVRPIGRAAAPELADV